MTPSVAPECCRRRRRTGVYLVLVLVLVLTESAVSMRGPEENWLGPTHKSGKTAHVFYGSSGSSSRNNLVGFMRRGSKQNIDLKRISHPFPTTYRPRPPPHPQLSNPTSHPHSILTTNTPNATSYIPKPLINAPHSQPSVPTLKTLPDPRLISKNHLSQKPRTTHANSLCLLPALDSASRGLKAEGSLTGRRLSRRLRRRKAAYPRRHLVDSRRSHTPGPPYDHYRRIVHVPLGTPTTLAPLPPTLHTLPQPPTMLTQPTHSKQALRGRLYPKKTLSQPSPSFVPRFREDKPHVSSHFLSPIPLRPPPPPSPSPSRHFPIPTRPYHVPSPRPYRPRFPHPASTPSSHPPFITSATPPPLQSLPFSFSTVPPHASSSSPLQDIFHRPFQYKPPLQSTHSAQPPAVFSLGRSSTPRSLVHPPPVPESIPSHRATPPPIPPPTSSPSSTTTSSPSRTLPEVSREHRKPDYPKYASVPVTSFTCRATPRPGIYGDLETHCQAWHVCEADGRQHSFLCPNGTVFSQHLLTCDWWYNVQCGSDHLNSIHTRPSREVSMGHPDPGLLFGRKLTKKPIKSYFPNQETVTFDGEQESSEPVSAT